MFHTLTLFNCSEVTEDVDAILLRNVIDDIVKVVGVKGKSKRRKTPVVIKIDIETFECRAFLGSPKIFSHPHIYIPYIVMEWTYPSQERTVRTSAIAVKSGTDSVSIFQRAYTGCGLVCAGHFDLL